MLSKLFMWADVCLALQICSCAVTVFFHREQLPGVGGRRQARQAAAEGQV